MENSKIFWMGVIGFIAATFFLLAPLHEFWHIIVSLFHGYVPDKVRWTAVWSDDLSISMSLAGPFGELLSFGAIFVYAIWKEKLYLAIFMIGYMFFNVLIYSIPGFIPVDFQFAMRYSNQDWLVMFLLWISRFMNYAWFILAIITVRKVKVVLKSKQCIQKYNNSLT